MKSMACLEYERTHFVHSQSTSLLELRVQAEIGPMCERQLTAPLGLSVPTAADGTGRLGIVVKTIDQQRNL